nr:hypothetical protein MACL_00001809 [Theileria orientalis]
MIKNYHIQSPSQTHSEYEESFFNDSVAHSSILDYDYPSFDSLREVEISDSELAKLCLEYYFNSSFENVVHDRPSFFLFRAEVLLNLRKYKDALSSCLCFEICSSPNLISKAIKMICFYQLNYSKNFTLLKDELMTSNLESLSDSLRKTVIGTIQVSAWIPELMNCLNNMKNTKE